MPIKTPYEIPNFLPPKPTKERSRLSKILDVLQTPLYATAGVAKEFKKRGYFGDEFAEEGYVDKPLIEAARVGIKRHTTYGDIVESKPLAFALDVFGDPVTYIPAAWMGKLVKGGMLATKAVTKPPLKLGAKAAKKVTGYDLEAYAEKVADWMGEAFKKNYKLSLLPGKGEKWIKAQEKLFNELETLPEFLGKKVHDELVELMPNIKDRHKVFGLLERRPVYQDEATRATALATKAGQQWKQEVDALTPKVREGYDLALSHLNTLERLKIKAHLLNVQQAEGFIAAGGIAYVPWMRHRKAFYIESLKDFKRKIIKGDKTALDRVKAMGKSSKTALEDIEKYLTEIQDISELVSPGIMREMQKHLSFTHLRKNKGTPAEIANAMGDQINMDIAAVLGIHTSDVHRGVLSFKYVEAIGKELKRMGLALDESILRDPIELRARLAAKFKPEDVQKYMRGGFTKLDDVDIPGIRGLALPKALADEIKEVIIKYQEPEQVNRFLEHYTKVQNTWKAWTLSLFPSYHSRNAISNVWNNYLAGMSGPRSISAYNRSMALLFKKWQGSKLSPREAKLIHEATNSRVLRGGLFEGELRHLIENISDHRHFFRGFIDPAQNKGIKFGFKAGTAIENHARFAHYIWAREIKGMSADKAAKSVQKYLFDYKYGLTPFEKKFFRDGLMPFYTWTRFNMPLQLEMLALKPGKFTAMAKSIDALEDEFGGPQPDEIFMADWMKRALKIRLRYDKNKEQYHYFILDSWIPAADINKLIQIKSFRDMITSLISPFTKTPIEILYNYNLFRKKQIKEFPGQRKALFGVPVLTSIEHAARSVRAINEADKWIDALVLKTGDTTVFEMGLRSAIGKAYPYKPEQQKIWFQNQARYYKGALKYFRKRADKYGEKFNIEQLDKLIAEQEMLEEMYK
jgi:hypothetical protein